MMDKYTQIRHINNLLFLFYQVFVVGTLCAFRAVSSIMIGLILVTSIIQNKNLQGVWLNRQLKHPFVITCGLFFLLQLIPLAYTNNFFEGWKHVQVKSALLFIPLCFYSCACINKVNFHSLMIVYIYTLAALLIWSLGVGCNKYFFHHATTSVFFYHELVSNLGHHAVQFSIFVFAGLIYLLHLNHIKRYLKNKTVHFSLIAWLIIGIVLLSSKLVIIFTLGYLIYHLYTSLQKKTIARSVVAIALIAGIICSSAILLTQNPISRRFNDVLHGNIAVVQQPSFNTRDYFNGVQFRLLQWRFVKEILTEHKAWLFGVTPAAAQPLLNQKYMATHMYTGGRPGGSDRGYLDYNTHNQFLESLLQTGIVGLLCFIAICVQLVIMAMTRQFDYTNRLLRALLLLLFAYTFSDAVFETQYGLILFLFMPLLFYTGQAGKYPAKPEE
ncbi:O-antigen ligase family protein [Niastella vici]|nr:O-antigen ligase family protein [Niastella vici]